MAVGKKIISDLIFYTLIIDPKRKPNPAVALEIPKISNSETPYRAGSNEQFGSRFFSPSPHIRGLFCDPLDLLIQYIFGPKYSIFECLRSFAKYSRQIFGDISTIGYHDFSWIPLSDCQKFHAPPPIFS